MWGGSTIYGLRVEAARRAPAGGAKRLDTQAARCYR